MSDDLVGRYVTFRLNAGSSKQPGASDRDSVGYRVYAKTDDGRRVRCVLMKAFGQRDAFEADGRPYRGQVVATYTVGKNRQSIPVISEISPVQ